jgi:hypothetical protein
MTQLLIIIHHPYLNSMYYHQYAHLLIASIFALFFIILLALPVDICLICFIIATLQLFATILMLILLLLASFYQALALYFTEVYF